MKKFLVFAVMATIFLVASIVVAQNNVSEKQICTNGYYETGIDPVDPDRAVRIGECWAKWNSPIAGSMGTKSGFRGNKCLRPLTPIIFSKEYLGKVIQARTELTLLGCGNGFIPVASLDTATAEVIDCKSEPSVSAPAEPTPPTTPQPKVEPKNPPTVLLWAELNGERVTSVSKDTIVIVRWRSENANRCSFISPTWLETDESVVNGRSKVKLNEDTEFLIRCYGTGGVASAEYSINVKHRRVWPWIVGGLVAGGLYVILNKDKDDTKTDTLDDPPTGGSQLVSSNSKKMASVFDKIDTAIKTKPVLNIRASATPSSYEYIKIQARPYKPSLSFYAVPINNGGILGIRLRF